MNDPYPIWDRPGIPGALFENVARGGGFYLDVGFIMDEPTIRLAHEFTCRNLKVTNEILDRLQTFIDASRGKVSE